MRLAKKSNRLSTFNNNIGKLINSSRLCWFYMFLNAFEDFYTCHFVSFIITVTFLLHKMLIISPHGSTMAQQC